MLRGSKTDQTTDSSLLLGKQGQFLLKLPVFPLSVSDVVLNPAPKRETKGTCALCDYRSFRNELRLCVEVFAAKETPSKCESKYLFQGAPFHVKLRSEYPAGKEKGNSSHLSLQPGFKAVSNLQLGPWNSTTTSPVHQAFWPVPLTSAFFHLMRPTRLSQLPSRWKHQRTLHTPHPLRPHTIPEPIKIILASFAAHLAVLIPPTSYC